MLGGARDWGIWERRCVMLRSEQRKAFWSGIRVWDRAPDRALGFRLLLCILGIGMS